MNYFKYVMSTATRIIILVLLLVFQTSIYSRDMYSYTARISCYKNTSTTSEYFLSPDDGEAIIEIGKILKAKNSYKGKDCKLMELISGKPHSQSSSSRSHMK